MTETRTKISPYFSSAAVISLAFAFIVYGKAYAPGSSVWWSILLGTLCGLTINFTVAAAKHAALEAKEVTR